MFFSFSSGIKLYGSIRSRKVSSQSIHSDTKFIEGEPSSEDIESMTYYSEEPQDNQVVEEQQEQEDEKMYTNMSWMKVNVYSKSLTIRPQMGMKKYGLNTCY